MSVFVEIATFVEIVVFVEIVMKVALIVVFALAVMPLLRNRAAALRHWVLSTALVCAALAPALQLIVPSWRLPIGLTSSVRESAPPSRVPDVETTIIVAGDGGHGDTSRGFRPEPPLAWGTWSSFGNAIQAIWIAGGVLGLGVLLVGLGRLGGLASSARRISAGVWVDCAEEVRQAYGLRRPVVLLQSAHPTLLVTWGVLQPKILLPAGARLWEEDRVRLVLYHELAHIRRGDWIVQLAAELMRSVYWFNPLIWIACSRLRRESERACDDAVLNRGIESSTYATHLVNIARELQQRRMWVPAPSIARTSHLEWRVRAMLDARLNRRPISRSACAATLLALLAVTIPVTGVALAQAVFATVTGSVVDPMSAALPGVTIVLTNEQSKAKHEVRSDHTGRYEFVGVAAGEYLLEARLPGFAALHGKLTVAGQNVQQDLKLQVGSLEETITVRDKYVPGPPVRHGLPQPQDRRSPREARACGNTPSPGGTAIGGNLRPPAKLLDVRPQYPASMLSAGVEGTVILQARIESYGKIEEVSVISTPHADLADAAVEAVRQWEFDSTLLNCVPLAVNMKVTINFERER